MKKQFFYHNINSVFGTRIHVIFGKRNFRKYIENFGLHVKLNFESSDVKGKAGRFKINGNYQYAIAFHECYPNLEVIVHECTHIVDRLRKRYKIKDSEFNAYLMQYLFKQIIDLRHEINT
jgi:uncharacterized protein (DUF1810 family)